MLSSVGASLCPDRRLCVPLTLLLLLLLLLWHYFLLPEGALSFFWLWNVAVV
jgi:hypothetical protein